MPTEVNARVPNFFTDRMTVHFEQTSPEACFTRSEPSGLAIDQYRRT
jgi:hypothetical protein